MKKDEQTEEVNSAQQGARDTTAETWTAYGDQGT